MSSLRLGWLYAVVFLTALATVLGYAQTTVTKESSPVSQDANKVVALCDPEAIDTTFAFHDQPADQQTISLYFVNKGSTICRLKDPPNPSFSAISGSMYVDFCPFCDSGGKSLPMWNRRPENEAVLAPGAAAAADLSWASTGQPCQWADSVTISLNWAEGYHPREFTSFFFNPSGWPMHICSSVRSSGYRAATNAPLNEVENNPALRVSLLQTTIYNDETATLHVQLSESAQPSEDSIGCASLYLVRHSDPPLHMRLEPLPTVGRVKVDSYTPQQIREDKERTQPSWKKDLRRECDIAAGTLSADAEIAASELPTITHIEWRTAPVSGREPVFFAAASRFTVRDVDTLPPNWGQTVQGIRAGLSVDRVKFTAGDVLPLHLRWEDLDATAPLADGDCGDPPKLQVEIQNSEHQVLKMIRPNMGCGRWGPFAADKGVAHHLFERLTTDPPPSRPGVTFFPVLTHPGVYYLVTVWSPRVIEMPDSASGNLRAGTGRLGEAYATVRSQAVRVELVPNADE